MIKTRTIHNIIGLLVLCYSFYGIVPLCIIGGPCNGGAILIGVGVFLLICSALTIGSIIITNKSIDENHRNLRGVTLSVISLLIWTFTFISIAIGDPIEAWKYFPPLIVLNAFTIYLSLSIKKLK